MDKIQSIFLFDRNNLKRLTEQYKRQYYNSSPFPHIVIDDFLPVNIVTNALAVFPPSSSTIWLDRKIKEQPGKLGTVIAERLEGADPLLLNILFAFNSAPFITFLESLTAIDGLVPDPHFRGGGLHQILSGGKLAIHSDYNYHKKLNLYRRINVLLYLNEGWKEEYGGYLELWNKDMSTCVKRIAPIFNRCVIFNTDINSYHGHPSALSCPEHITRKSMALYYYTRDPKPGDEEIHETLWQVRPCERS